jgi:hypothetical protein
MQSDLTASSVCKFHAMQFSYIASQVSVIAGVQYRNKRGSEYPDITDAREISTARRKSFNI